MAVFSDVVNPVDGVVYPRICSAIPADITAEIYAKLEAFKGSPIKNPTLFMRMSPEGVHCPHKVHSDASMGTHSLMLYLNEPSTLGAGTSFVGHIDTGIGYAPALEDFAQIITAAQNDDAAWAIHDFAHMKANRAVIFKADRLHRAEPVGGFGSTNQDARLVLTCFFS